MKLQKKNALNLSNALKTNLKRRKILLKKEEQLPSQDSPKVHDIEKENK